MTHYHGREKKTRFFEGWYLKHQNGTQTLALIPSLHIDRDGRKKAYLQIITDKASACVVFPADSFSACEDHFEVRLGDNHFSLQGVHLQIDRPELQCSGDLTYGALTPVRYDAMGPFRLIKNMECNHGVLSLRHSLRGSIRFGGETYCFDDGTGYIEKDWGCSFPKEYAWLHCNDFSFPGSVMVSIADIPFAGGHFRGCIAVVWIDGREYRLATYNGARVIRCNETGLVIRRGPYCLAVYPKKGTQAPLLACAQGAMGRTIYERASCPARFALCKNGRPLLRTGSANASFEFVAPTAKGGQAHG